MAFVDSSPLKGISSLVAEGFYSERLDISFLYDHVMESHKNDPLINVVSGDIYLGEDRVSSLCYIDPDEEIVHVGPSEMKRMPYEPIEDKSGVDVILDFCRKSDFKYTQDMFPDVPIAKDGFPPNQHYRPLQGYPVEYMMAREGVRLLDVSLGCIQEVGLQFPCYTTRDNVTGLDKYQENDGNIYFSPYHDVKKKNVICMQFNPFHPMATRMIQSMEWNGNVVSGTYLYRAKVIKFSFDLDDKRYRIHSEEWRQKISCNGFLEIFDLVSETDFAYILSLKDKKIFNEPFVLEPLIVEMLRDSPYPYSHLGPFAKSIKRGVGEIVYTPYSRFHFVQNEGDRYREITSQSIYYPDKTLNYNDREYVVKDGLLDDDNIFLKVIKRDDHIFFRAFIRDEAGDSKFHFIKKLSFSSFPRNRDGTIIYPYNVITLLDSIRSGEHIHEFLPMFVPQDETVDYVFDEPDSVLIKEDVIKIDIAELDKSRPVDYKSDSGKICEYYCYQCEKVIAKDPHYDNTSGIIRTFHKACALCMCGERENIYLNVEERKFYCIDSYLCMFQRCCYVCKSRVSYGSEVVGSSYFVHRDCVRCNCLCFKDLFYSINRAECYCMSGKGVKKQIPMQKLRRVKKVGERDKN